MEISLKKVVAIAIAGASAFGAMTASADVVLPGTGNGELVLFVRDLNNSERVYARGLNITLDQVLTQASIVGDTYEGPVDSSFSYSLPTIAADANLSTFLGTSSSYVWTVMAGDTGPFNSNAVGNRRYLTTVPRDFNVDPSTIINSQLGSSFSNLEGMLQSLNGDLPDGAGTSTAVNGTWGQGSSAIGAFAGDWFGTSLINENAVGSAANFYMLTSAGGVNLTLARAYSFGALTLNLDGSLTASSTAPVPLPAAFWLLGTGLAGLAGVARRRVVKA